MRRCYPFAAIHAQPQLRRALLALVLCPNIGGVLLRGQKGTAKSTAVRALPQLLQGSPLVEVPLNTTEDRLTGSLDMEAALRLGQRQWQPGLLNAAHGGMLYVDEVNLLPDHLVDMLLDAAGSGAQGFALMGSMNPEEGELRPQLLDRFGLCVDVLAPEDMPSRLEILRRRLAFDEDPAAFLRLWQPQQESLARTLAEARARLLHLRVPKARVQDMAELAAAAHCTGHRGELALWRTARALAALDGCAEVRDEHVREAAALALAHRRREHSPAPQQETAQEHLQHAPPQEGSHTPQSSTSPAPSAESLPPMEGESAQPKSDTPHAAQGEVQEQIFAASAPFTVKPFTVRKDRTVRQGNGRHSRSLTAGRSGRCVGWRERPLCPDSPLDIALEPTLCAAALRQAQAGQTYSNQAGLALPLRITPQDWRHKKRERKMGNLIVFAVDASGSMGAARRMSEAKGAVLSLLLHAYQKRDQVALIAFRGQEGKTLLHPTGSVELACRELEELPTGGKTPLAGGLAEARRVMHNALRKNPHVRPILLVISDGKANVAPPLAMHSSEKSTAATAWAAALEEGTRIALDARIQSLVVDVERGGLLRFGQARPLAKALHAPCVSMEELHAATLVDMVREMTA